MSVFYLRLAGRQTAAFGLDPDRCLLPVVARDRAVPLGRLVKGGPTLEGELHFTDCLGRRIYQRQRIGPGQLIPAVTDCQRERGGQKSRREQRGAHS